ncbi:MULTISPECIES: hypothetical protein [unclassified Rhizobium]|uniref:hypothetical protein n=1 Tax=unclassified Rhizobium TaxID=2613769 RepID=UPI0007E99303|nr:MULTISPECIES: hypothetical protein [unclassified Rhizobium]
MNGSGPNTTYQGREIGDLDPVDQKAKFCAEIAAFANAAMDGNLTRRMNADYTDPDLRRSAALLNELISSIDDNLSDFNDAMAAFAHGDLRVGMRDKHRGAFRPLQKNFNLAVATIRTVLGERGSERFTDKATKFRRMMAAVRGCRRYSGLRRRFAVGSLAAPRSLAEACRGSARFLGLKGRGGQRRMSPAQILIAPQPGWPWRAQPSGRLPSAAETLLPLRRDNAGRNPRP